MTKLQENKPLLRETAVKVQDRDVVVVLKPHCIELRLKRTRKVYTLGYEAAIEAAVKAAWTEGSANLSKFGQKKGK